MANFTKFVTGMPLGPSVSASDSSILRMGRHASSPEMKRVDSPDQLGTPDGTREDGKLASASASTSEHGSGSSTPTGGSVSRKQSLRRALSHKVAMAGRVLGRQSREPIQEGSPGDSVTSSDIDGSTPRRKAGGHATVSDIRYAGESSVYEDLQVR